MVKDARGQIDHLSGDGAVSKGEARRENARLREMQQVRRDGSAIHPSIPPADHPTSRPPHQPSTPPADDPDVQLATPPPPTNSPTHRLTDPPTHRPREIFTVAWLRATIPVRAAVVLVAMAAGMARMAGRARTRTPRRVRQASRATSRGYGEVSAAQSGLGPGLGRHWGRKEGMCWCMCWCGRRGEALACPIYSLSAYLPAPLATQGPWLYDLCWLVACGLRLARLERYAWNRWGPTARAQCPKQTIRRRPISENLARIGHC